MDSCLSPSSLPSFFPLLSPPHLSSFSTSLSYQSLRVLLSQGGFGLSSPATFLLGVSSGQEHGSRNSPLPYNLALWQTQTSGSVLGGVAV